MFASSKPVLSAVALAVLGAMPSAYAQDSTSSDDTTETMVVTAAGYDQKVQNASASVTVITREELESRYYRDIADALSSVPGVVVTGGGDAKDISIRGMGSAYTLILVDGKRVSTRQTRPNSDGPGVEDGWLPPLEAIERIEVIKGPMSTLYGSDAIGGVINVITSKSHQHWTGKISLSTVLQEDRDSGDEQNGNFFVTGPLTDSLSLQVYGQNQHRDEDNIINGYAENDMRSINTKLTYQLSDNHQFSLDAGINEQDSRSNADKSYESTSAYALSSDYTEAKYSRKTAALSHQGTWGDNAKENSYVQYERSYSYSRDITLNNTEYKTTVVMPFATNTLSMGVQAQHESMDDTTTNTGGTITHLSNTDFALFVEDEWRVLDPLALTGGIRYQHDQRYGSHFSPRVYSVWNIDDAWTLKGGVSTGFRAPDLRQSSPGWVQASRGGNRYGTADLKPEKSVTEEINLAYRSEQGLHAELGLFNNDFKDMITTTSCTASTCDTLTNSWGNTNKRNVNVDKAVTRGVEASFDTPVTDTIDFKTSYTYTYSRQKTGDNKGNPLENLPKHLVSSDVTWRATEKLDSWLKYTYHGVERADSGATPVPSYTFFDAGITYQLADNVKVKGAVYNLFDKTVDYDTYGYTEDGRRYWLGMDVAF
ncbi:TonB-dependent receptor domain-containing protein [Vibrio porteresiae]|uniref:TonB-dependent receptor domain-containing protein n=1 Tax=Vibrio porteresiae TaxID=435912 RepID=UPI004032BAC7